MYNCSGVYGISMKSQNFPFKNMPTLVVVVV